MKAKFVFEALKDVLTGRPLGEIQRDLYAIRDNWTNPLLQKAFDYINGENDPISEAFVVTSAKGITPGEDSAEYFDFKIVGLDGEWTAWSIIRHGKKPGQTKKLVELENFTGWSEEYSNWDDLQSALLEISMNRPQQVIINHLS